MEETRRNGPTPLATPSHDVPRNDDQVVVPMGEGHEVILDLAELARAGDLAKTA